MLATTPAAKAMALIDKDKIDGMIESKKLSGTDVTGLVIDLPSGTKAITTSGQPGKPKKRPNHNKGWWPDEKKLEVATLYAALGNFTRVAKIAKVPVSTVERWSQEEWFMQTLQKVRREENFLTDKKFSTIVDKALAKLEERIEEGDYIYDIKRGMAVPVPVSARDLTIVTGTLFDKRQLLRGEATKITQAVNSEEHLKVLANKFAEYVKQKERVINSTGDVNAVQESGTESLDVREQTENG